MAARKHRSLTLVVGIVVAIAIVGLWYLFRPELLFIDKRVSEPLPPAPVTAAKPAEATPIAVTQGMFRGLAHETKGVATIYRLADGKRFLRFTEFETSNGPDVHVYLVKADDAKDEATVKRAGFVDLGSMKGNKGDQNYDVPADVDLGAHRAVSIWCARFSVNFGAAPLKPRG